MLGKRPPSFFSSSSEKKTCGTGRRCQTVTGLEVDFVEPLIKKGPTVLHVWPCVESQSKISGVGIDWEVSRVKRDAGT